MFTEYLHVVSMIFVNVAVLFYMLTVLILFDVLLVLYGSYKRLLLHSFTSFSPSLYICQINTTQFQSSTKIEALMEELHKMKHMDLGAKAIVFSQFVNMLDVSVLFILQY